MTESAKIFDFEQEKISRRAEMMTDVVSYIETYPPNEIFPGLDESATLEVEVVNPEADIITLKAHIIFGEGELNKIELSHEQIAELVEDINELLEFHTPKYQATVVGDGQEDDYFRIKLERQTT